MFPLDFRPEGSELGRPFNLGGTLMETVGTIYRFGTIIIVIWALISILWPIKPFRSRWAALAVFVGVVIFRSVVGPYIPDPQEARIAAIDAEKAEKLAEREALKQSDPQRYAALLAEEAEKDRKAREALEIRLAEERERIATELANSTVKVQWDAEDWADQIKKLSRHIEKVELIDQEGGPLKGELVRVTYFDPLPMSESALLFMASDTYMKAARSVFENKPTTSGIQFIVKSNAIDEYGRTEAVFAFVFGLPRAEMKKIVWDNVIGADILNLSSVDRKSLGRSIGKSYCEDYGDNARRFCKTAAR